MTLKIGNAVHTMNKKYVLTEHWYNALLNSHAAIEAEDKAKELKFDKLEKRLIVEIGVFQGASSCWWSDNFLEHPYSKLISIDPFTGSSEHHADKKYEEPLKTLEFTARNNIAYSAQPGKVEVVRGYSWEVYAKLRPDFEEGIDILYIDGAHEPEEVVRDTSLYAPHVKSGGAIIFDDYGHPDVQRAVNSCIQGFLDLRYALATGAGQLWAVRR